MPHNGTPVTDFNDTNYPMVGSWGSIGDGLAVGRNDGTGGFYKESYPKIRNTIQIDDDTITQIINIQQGGGVSVYSRET